MNNIKTRNEIVNNNLPEKMVTGPELAEYLSVTYWTIKYKLIKDGMPYYRIGSNQGHYRFLVSEVKEWLQNRKHN